MNYEMFLFSQLFMWFAERHEVYEDTAYDIMYPEVLKHRELFLQSEYNVDTKSEYECINEYLSNELIK